MYQKEYMELAIKLAQNCQCSPNPAVGAVIVKDGKVIGQGFTQPYGEEHAEVQAIKNCIEDTQGADLYVTLEPCSHYGKTPPCVEAIYRAGIKNVYAGIKDPNPKVNGKGFFMLQTARINVEFPFFEEIIKKQLEHYLVWIQSKKPFVIMKNIISLDGKILTDNGDINAFSNAIIKDKIQNLRDTIDAVLIANPTVVPELASVLSKGGGGGKSLIILDPNLELEPKSYPLKIILFYHKDVQNKEKIDLLNKNNIDTYPVSMKHGLLNINEILLTLGSLGISSLLTETDTDINSQLIKNELVNKIYFFILPQILGGNKNVFDSLNISKIDNKIDLTDIQIEVFDDEIMFVGYPDYKNGGKDYYGNNLLD